MPATSGRWLLGNGVENHQSERRSMSGCVRREVLAGVTVRGGAAVSWAFVFGRVRQAFGRAVRCWLVASGLLASISCSDDADDRWLITATRVYVAPESPPIDDGWVLVRAGEIEAVGASTAARPKGVRIHSACSGGVVAAGFQNSHVHLATPAFEQAAIRPAAELQQALSQMLTSFGFTTVVDTGSIVVNSVALRQRVEGGEVPGPAILTAGLPLYPEDGIPLYLRDFPAEILRQLPQPGDSAEAVAVIAENFALGANGTKLFIATPQGGGEIRRMSAPIARAAAEETHRRGGLVMAHPTDVQGVRDAVEAGVDIIVHTTIDPAGSAWSDDLVRDMVARHVSVVPTLKLWGYELDQQGAALDEREAAIDAARKEVEAFVKAGGQLLFGTDVGYMADFDPTDEYVLMARAGLSPMQILATLTTSPAVRWRDGERRGRVAAGFAADLVVLDGDPAAEVENFADVRCTIRGGHEVFTRALLR
jgi:imidazolonepropionase-like amidohydrolase